MLQMFLWVVWEVFVGLVGLGTLTLGILNYIHRDEWAEGDGWLSVVCFMATALCIQHLYFTLT